MYKKNKILIGLILLTLVAVVSGSSFWLTSRVQAQELQESDQELSRSEQSDEASRLLPEDAVLSSSQVILRRERLTAEIQDQRDQLLGQLSEYQKDERRYRVALDQFQRLQTLSSIEEVVAASKKLVLSRNLVLHSYLNLLRLKLVESEGIEVRHKSRTVEQLEGLAQQLLDHSNKVEQINDREAINQLAEEFVPLSESITEISHYALSVLAIGRLQSVYDQSVVVHQRILQKDSEEAVPSNTSRNRSLSEVERLINELPPVFLSVWSKVDQAGDSRYGYRNLYRSITTELNTIYSRLSRLTAYYEELENVK